MNTTRALTLFLALALSGLVLLALPIATARAADPVIVRVTTSGTITWPCGSSWANACALQSALSNTLSGSELWVAAGTYKPTTGISRTATFQLRDGVALYGGFAGGETLRSQRNYTANITILSGDIGIPGDSSDNSYHVVVAFGLSNSGVLDGFTVTGGQADDVTNIYCVGISCGGGGGGGGMSIYVGSPTLANLIFHDNWAYYGGGMFDNGWCATGCSSSPTLTNVTFISNTARGLAGGMYNYQSSPTLTNVIFSGNTTSSRLDAVGGGGMYNYSNSNPTLTNVTFSGNSAPHAFGGGMYNDNNSNPTLVNVTFSGNTTSNGGGMVNFDSSPTLTNVTFSGNSADTSGGGMESAGGSPTLTNVTFSDNIGGGTGGAIDNWYSSPTLTNVTFIHNTASYGGAMYSYHSSPILTNATFSGNYADISVGGMNNISSSLTIRNTIVWNSWPLPEISNEGGTVSISDSVIQGGCPAGSTCTNIITADPRLGRLANYGGSTQTIPLLVGSSAIDAGNDAVCPPTDQRGVPRPQGAHCDIGAFEGQLTELDLPLIGR